MLNSWLNHTLISKLGVVAGLALVVMTALQYPLSTTFPIGADAAAYISDAEKVLSIPFHPAAVKVLRQTWYPLSDLLFATMAVIPIEWPQRFIWWAVLGQIAVGGCLSWLLYRLTGWPAAAAGAAMWALTPVIALPHFEAGTIAQLWSYTTLLLTLERWHSQKAGQVLLLTLVTFLLHPITGLILFLTISSSLIALRILRETVSPATQAFQQRLSWYYLVFGAMCAFVLWYRYASFSLVAAKHVSSIAPLDFLRSGIGPLVLLAPVGITVIFSKYSKNPPTILALVAFISVSTLMSMNNILGISIWVERLASFFVVSICLLAGLAWPYLITTMSPIRSLRWLLTIIFFSAMLISTWSNNQAIYRFYESPSRYARVHPAELAAMIWMRDNLPAEATIFSTTANRHTEWVPIIAQRHWEPIRVDTVAMVNQEQPLYFLVLVKREAIPEIFVQNPTTYPVIFQNEAAVLFQISNPQLIYDNVPHTAAP